MLSSRIVRSASLFMSPGATATAVSSSWAATTATPKARPSRTAAFSAAASKRGSNAVSLLPSYLSDARAVERYCPKTAPNGALQLGVAENQMLEDLLVPAYTNFASTAPFASDLIYYQPTHSRPSLRDAMAKYLERLLKLGGEPLDRDGLVLGAGCNAVLENLCFTLTEAKQGVLIPAPYYAAFEFDLVARADLSILPVTTMDYCGVNVPAVGEDATIPLEAYYPSTQALDAAYEQALENGVEPRVLLLSHPNNPLGICYPPDVVKECIQWCRSRRVHLISDEIYAGSVYGDADNFVSALELAGGPGNLGPYVHFVYALSKDFASSGLRVGISYSENKDIRLPLQKLNDLCQISSQTQQLVETMMTSTSDQGQLWTDNFLTENCSRIRKRAQALSCTLDKLGVPHLTPDAGLFCWMDMAEFLPDLDPAMITTSGKEDLESMQVRERTLYLELMKEHGLLFTPGMSMRNERPGFFRCVFTAASDHEFTLSLERLESFVAAKRI